MSRDNDGGNVDREKKRGGESRQNLRDHKELHYIEGEVIYVKIWACLTVKMFYHSFRNWTT